MLKAQTHGCADGLLRGAEGLRAAVWSDCAKCWSEDSAHRRQPMNRQPKRLIEKAWERGRIGCWSDCVSFARGHDESGLCEPFCGCYCAHSVAGTGSQR